MNFFYVIRVTMRFVCLDRWRSGFVTDFFFFLVLFDEFFYTICKLINS